MENLEERVEEEIENNSESKGVLQRLIRNKWLRRSLLPLAAATSIFFGYPRLSETLTSKQQTTLNHDPVLLIHGLEIKQDDFKQYCDFNVNRFVSFDDFFLLAEKFNPNAEYERGFDIDRDGKIRLEDFFLFTNAFNETVEPLEFTWDALSRTLHGDMKWKNGGTIGKWVLDRDLQAADFYTIRLSSGNKLNFNEQGEEVGLAVEKILKATKKEKVILIGFSMGGLAARAYLQNDQYKKASALVTICTPHAGSFLAYLPEKVEEIKKWMSDNNLEEKWVAEAGDFYIDYLASGKPAIRYLRPGSADLIGLNRDIHKMPTDILYANLVSQVPNQGLLNRGINLISKSFSDFKKTAQVAREEELAKGDGIVPTVSQLLRYAILSANAKNVEWYEKARNNFLPENAEMQVFHTKGNKQTAVIKKVLDDVIEKIESNRGGDEEGIVKVTNFISPLKVGDYSIAVFKGDINETIRSDVTGIKIINGKEAFVTKNQLAVTYVGLDGDKILLYGGVNDNIGEFYLHPPVAILAREMRIKTPVITTGYVESKDINLGTSLKFRYSSEIFETGKSVSYSAGGRSRRFDNCLLVKSEQRETLSGTNLSQTTSTSSYFAPNLGDVYGSSRIIATDGDETASLGWEYFLVMSSYLSKPAIQQFQIPLTVNIEFGKSVKQFK